jgi:hypothetical protein
MTNLGAGAIHEPPAAQSLQIFHSEERKRPSTPLVILRSDSDEESFVKVLRLRLGMTDFFWTWGAPSGGRFFLPVQKESEERARQRDNVSKLTHPSTRKKEMWGDVFMEKI